MGNERRTLCSQRERIGIECQLLDRCSRSLIRRIVSISGDLHRTAFISVPVQTCRDTRSYACLPVPARTAGQGDPTSFSKSFTGHTITNYI